MTETSLRRHLLECNLNCTSLKDHYFLPYGKQIFFTLFFFILKEKQGKLVSIIKITINIIEYFRIEKERRTTLISDFLS